MEQYTDDIDNYWNQNPKVFHLDSISWIYLWGGFTIWALLTALCFMKATLKYPTLPEQIPIQWSGGNVSSSVAKGFIFANPLACVIIRFLLRPIIRRWLQINVYESESITNYLVNFLCFVAFTAELFTILFLVGIVKHISVVYS